MASPGPDPETDPETGEATLLTPHRHRPLLTDRTSSYFLQSLPSVPKNPSQLHNPHTCTIHLFPRPCVCPPPRPPRHLPPRTPPPRPTPPPSAHPSPLPSPPHDPHNPHIRPRRAWAVPSPTAAGDRLHVRIPDAEYDAVGVVAGEVSDGTVGTERWRLEVEGGVGRWVEGQAAEWRAGAAEREVVEAGWVRGRAGQRERVLQEQAAAAAREEEERAEAERREGERRKRETKMERRRKKKGRKTSGRH